MIEKTLEDKQNMIEASKKGTKQNGMVKSISL